jgi:hypothetical protein
MLDPLFEDHARQVIREARDTGHLKIADLMEAHIDAWKRYCTFADTLDQSMRKWLFWYWRIILGFVIVGLVMFLGRLPGGHWYWAAYWAYLTVMILRLAVGYSWKWILRVRELHAWHQFMACQEHFK